MERLASYIVPILKFEGLVFTARSQYEDDELAITDLKTFPALTSQAIPRHPPSLSDKLYPCPLSSFPCHLVVDPLDFEKSRDLCRMVRFEEVLRVLWASASTGAESNDSRKEDAEEHGAQDANADDQRR